MNEEEGRKARGEAGSGIFIGLEYSRGDGATGESAAVAGAVVGQDRSPWMKR